MGTRKSRIERRADLIDAARRAMIAYGTDTVGLNQVAEQAGLTSGAVLYHYPHLPDLLIEAHHAGMERFYEARVRAAAAVSDPAEKLVRTIRSGLPADADDADVRLLCELGGSAGRNRVYAALLTTLYDRQVSMYQGILEHGAARETFVLTVDSLTIGGIWWRSKTRTAIGSWPGIRRCAPEALELVLSYARQATGHPLTVGNRTRERPRRSPGRRRPSSVRSLAVPKRASTYVPITRPG